MWYVASLLVWYVASLPVWYVTDIEETGNTGWQIIAFVFGLQGLDGHGSETLFSEICCIRECSAGW